MTTPLRRGLGVLLAFVTVLGVAWLSRAPYHIRPSDAGVIRLAWSARPERIESCREPSAAELAQLPAHMRQKVVCEGTSARYRLRVSRDGASLVDEVVRGSGLRHDRPLYLLRDLPTPPGRHEIAVRFERIDSLTPVGPAAPDSGEHPDDSLIAGLPGRDRREADEREHRRLEAVPASLLLETTLVLEPRQILLVTYDVEGRRLVSVSGKAPR
ncbi:MAG: hypothetical protein SGJ01_02550 [Gemmatimonadota bacterium]|nr:hypothetical protein [Gemmatimonadota bacterium]